MSRALTVMPAAALALATLAGCGADPAPPAATATATATGQASAAAAPHGKRRQMEAMRADCMKQRGFKYIPNIPPPEKVHKDAALAGNGDYPAMRRYREKHGFGVYFAFAYPDDPEYGLGQSIPDPNMDLAQSLSKTQYKAWSAADNACYAAVFNKFTGKKVSSADDVTTQADDLFIKTRERRLDGDPQLVELAGDFGGCLKRKGYPVASLKPTAMAFNSWDMFEKERTTVLNKYVGSSAGKNFASLRLSPGEARPYLAKEIKVALDDLECGKDFYAAFLPRQTEIWEEVWNQFGQKDGLLPW
ncbi:hypothetical protein ACQPYK_43565 [Streptosporangium sp. CA-135522]|uniref:hypothetical protein n=1 Tax=Streptosporangium sp. CA-135522 TaxID=3240072 RepID=UPI003D94AD51